VSDRVEVVYALPERQRVITLAFTHGMTAGDALRLSRIDIEFPELAGRPLKIGIYGEVVSETRVLRPGDRVEIYRELAVDPREARRSRAALESRKGRGRRAG
jgi:putative ubiquitin-RnfH superfamily antitoxin RatB of RatAB toxin-antitoxin module